jgi:hypothetical protein
MVGEEGSDGGSVWIAASTFLSRGVSMSHELDAGYKNLSNSSCDILEREV